MPLTKAGFTYSYFGPFTKHEKKSKETVDSRNINQHKLDKTCFQRDMAYGEFKDLSRRTEADKVLHNKAFNIAKIKNIMIINAELLQCFISFLIKKPWRYY